MIIAFEGPCLSGKTTVMREVVAMLAARRPIAFPCYVAELSGMPPDPVGPSQAEQLAATRLFLDIETSRFDRVTSLNQSMVLLDRSIDTLGAHALAVSRYLGWSNAYSDTISMIRSEPRILIPSLTFFFVAPHAELVRRSASFPQLPPVYYDPMFLSGFREHFEGTERFARDLVFVDALGDPITTASFVVQETLSRSTSV